ncbi:hypothetical protein JB92DRAFT_3120689 [Gautieria morchelliformis]|nr:hypothetical protein JB92DRAFT_3120689 [Gautieria morchelliformis]
MTVLPWTHTSLGSQASRRAPTVTGVATRIAAEYTPHPIPTTTLTLRNYSPTQPSPRILAVLFFPRGHYGPAFVTYFDEQNANIDAGQLVAEKIVVSALTINKSASVLFHSWSISNHYLIAVDDSTLCSNTGYMSRSLEIWLEVSNTVQSYIDFAADAPGYGPLVNLFRGPSPAIVDIKVDRYLESGVCDNYKL